MYRMTKENSFTHLCTLIYVEEAKNLDNASGEKSKVHLRLIRCGKRITFSQSNARSGGGVRFVL